MTLYTELMSIAGAMTFLGILLTWSLARAVERVRLNRRGLSWLLLLGGLLTALGFISVASNKGNGPVFWAVLLGPAFIAYALAESNLVKASPEMFLQSAMAFIAVVMRNSSSQGIAESFSAVSAVILMNAIPSYAYSPRKFADLVRVASWLFVLFLLLENFPGFELASVLIYYISLSVWLYTLLRLHTFAKERLITSVQEGL
ncbi:hypothetical protein [Thermococcus sp.]|uniref:hypothetical protein n=1 Tax=Thermococcus sp. TaxID=35749 RepID=UPI00262B1EFA|nr:hypothetical protein [Thermococcus sp.]